MNVNDYRFVNSKTQYKPGMPYMIEVFATWCQPCLNMQQHISRMTQQYKNVYILSVSTQSYAEVYQLAMQRFIMLNFNVAVDQNNKAQQLMNQYGCQSIPHCFVFDGNNNLVFEGHPAQSEQVIAKLDKEYQMQQEQSAKQEQKQEQDNFKRTECNFSKL